ARNGRCGGGCARVGVRPSPGGTVGARDPRRGRVSSPVGRPAGSRTVLLPWTYPARLPSTFSSAQGLARITRRARVTPGGGTPPLPGAACSCSTVPLSGGGKGPDVDGCCDGGTAAAATSAAAGTRAGAPRG